MTRERLVSAEAQQEDEPTVLRAVRPQSLTDFVGQPALIEKLDIALQAVRERQEPMEHVLLHGPPGLGKTTIANLVAAEMGTRVVVTSGPALTKGGDLIGTLTRMQAGDVLFIDEIHRLPIAVEEYIYSAMEDFRIDFPLDSGMHAKMISYHLKPFSLIGATTRAGMLSGALRSRFGLVHHLQFYSDDDLAQILAGAAARMGLDPIDDEVRLAIARRSRGTPRVTLRLLRRARDFAQVRANGQLDVTAVNDALALEGVDEDGLDHLDRAYLETIGSAFDGGPAGVEAIAATIGEDRSTLEDVVEPFLLQTGLVVRTQRGRCLTARGAARVGATPPRQERWNEEDSP